MSRDELNGRAAVAVSATSRRAPAWPGGPRRTRHGQASGAGALAPRQFSVDEVNDEAAPSRARVLAGAARLLRLEVRPIVTHHDDLWHAARGERRTSEVRADLLSKAFQIKVSDRMERAPARACGHAHEMRGRAAAPQSSNEPYRHKPLQRGMSPCAIYRLLAATKAPQHAVCDLQRVCMLAAWSGPRWSGPERGPHESAAQRCGRAHGPAEASRAPAAPTRSKRTAGVDRCCGKGPPPR